MVVQMPEIMKSSEHLALSHLKTITVPSPGPFAVHLQSHQTAPLYQWLSTFSVLEYHYHTCINLKHMHITLDTPLNYIFNESK